MIKDEDVFRHNFSEPGIGTSFVAILWSSMRWRTNSLICVRNWSCDARSGLFFLGVEWLRPFPSSSVVDHFSPSKFHCLLPYNFSAESPVVFYPRHTRCADCNFLILNWDCQKFRSQRRQITRARPHWAWPSVVYRLPQMWIRPQPSLLGSTALAQQPLGVRWRQWYVLQHLGVPLGQKNCKWFPT